MNGIFGGLLSIIDSIGGGFLYILIGGAASKPGAATRLARLVIGAVVFGSVISLIIYLNSPERAFQNITVQNSSFVNDIGIPLIFFPPVAALLLTAVLELLSFVIEYKPKEKDVRETKTLRITPADQKEEIRAETRV